MNQRRAIPETGGSLADLFPHVAREWFYDKNHHLNLTPHSVVPNSGIKVWWRCQEGHVWEARVFTRTRNKRTAQCRVCRGQNEGSIIESKLRKHLNIHNACFTAPTEQQLTLPCGKIVVVDIVGTFMGRTFMVEYDGYRWHRGSDRRARDYRKTNALLNNGNLLIRVREDGLCPLKISHPNLLQLDYRQSVESEQVLALAENIWGHLEHHIVHGFF